MNELENSVVGWGTQEPERFVNLEQRNRTRVQFVNDNVTISMEETQWCCRSVVAGFNFLTKTKRWLLLALGRGSRSNLILFKFLAVVDCQLSGVGFGCRLYLSVVVNVFCCRRMSVVE
jgi:hypothetical protein